MCPTLGSVHKVENDKENSRQCEYCVCQTPSCPRTLALIVPSAWKSLTPDTSTAHSHLLQVLTQRPLSDAHQNHPTSTATVSSLSPSLHQTVFSMTLIIFDRVMK